MNAAIKPLHRYDLVLKRLADGCQSELKDERAKNIKNYGIRYLLGPFIFTIANLKKGPAHPLQRGGT